MAKLMDLNAEHLVHLYHVEKKSLGDIAKLYTVSRTAVYKKLKNYGIPQRSKSKARIEAQKQGKLPQEHFDINEDFFSNWSGDMAYVLGLLITDGCVAKTGQVSLNINDKELLEKVKKAMSSTHKIIPSKHQKGLYCYQFSRERMTQDLEKLNVVPRKSLIVKFPDVPKDYLPDFIRGVFDGDGSVFFKDSQRSPLRSKFISCSMNFIDDLQKSLEYLGLPKRTVYKRKTINAWSYEIVYDHKDSMKLFDILYKDTQNSLFLERKYRLFTQGINRYTEGSESHG